ncbi:MAG TPA: excinuclease ABC subunit C [Acidobacteriaceae bacterium]|jgi:excinuclease UvrABC nuclease subunit|nr:excinuclease ABC subunit C [Acidobacteriaceae bacterium]
MFPHRLAFDPANPAWDAIPAAAGVFSLFAEDPHVEPYISRTPNLRRRIRRLLDARPDQTKRLQLAGRVAHIEYALTGSEFEAWLRLYDASRAAFGDRVRKRLHLRAPFLLRMTVENAYPRVYVTNHVTKSGMDDLYGPFPSRAAAEHFLEDMLDLFKLRRCVDNLAPDPAFPGCVYSEMKKCLAPCFQGCSDERYADEAAAIRAFLRTGGASLVEALSHEREAASELLEFEKAADLHVRLTKAESVAAAAPEVLRPLAHLDGIIVQPCAEAECVALFGLVRGCLTGPAIFSVAGMRHPNEAAGSTSLYAQPVAAPEAVPLDAPTVTTVSRDELEHRLDQSLALLHPAPRKRSAASPIADHLCLFTRWYYRPQVKRVGEILFAGEAGVVSPKPLLRAISRVWQKSRPVVSHP